MSGVVILMMATIRDNENESLWTNDVASVASRFKTNSLKYYSHHGTSGFTYSFGNKPFYGQKYGISVSCYATKNQKIHIRIHYYNMTQDTLNINVPWPLIMV